MCFGTFPPTLTSNLLHRHLENPMQTLEAMLRPKVATLPGHIQAVYVQNAAKLFATVLKSQEGNTNSTAAQETSQLMIDRLPVFVQSANLEVQERVSWIDFFFFFFHLARLQHVPIFTSVPLPPSPLRRLASCSWSSTSRSCSRRTWRWQRKSALCLRENSTPWPPRPRRRFLFPRGESAH